MEVLQTNPDSKTIPKSYTDEGELDDANLNKLLALKQRRGIARVVDTNRKINSSTLSLTKKGKANFRHTAMTEIPEFETDIVGGVIANITDNSAAYFLKTLDTQLDNTDDALDYIYRTFYQKLSEGKYAFCNQILSGLKSESYSLVILMGFLTASFPWRHKLPSRITFHNEVKTSAKQVYSSAKAKSLLSGLGDL